MPNVNINTFSNDLMDIEIDKIMVKLSKNLTGSTFIRSLCMCSRPPLKNNVFFSALPDLPPPLYSFVE